MQRSKGSFTIQGYLGTGRSSIPCATPSWRRHGSRVFGGT